MSIQAMNWARQIRAGGCSAKAVLMTVADYADELGHGFPSLGRIAAETEQSVDTVRRRLRDFEAGGVLVRIERKTKDGRRTSDEIRLRIDLAPELLSEALAAAGSKDATAPAAAGSKDATAPAAAGSAETPAESAAGATVAEGGPSQPATLADCQGSPSKLPGSPSQALPGPSLNRENNNTPLTPQSAATADEIGYAAFAAAWPEPVLKPDLARRLWDALTDAERRAALAAVPAVAQHARRSRRRLTEATRWLRHRGWDGLGEKVSTPGIGSFLPAGSEQWRAWQVYRKATGLFVVESRGPSGEPGILPRAEWPPFGRGLPDYGAEWWFVVERSPQWWAWRDALRAAEAALGVAPRVVLITGPRGAGNVAGAVPGEDARLMRGAEFPSEWPPRRGAATGPPPGVGAPLTQDDVAAFLGTGT